VKRLALVGLTVLVGALVLGFGAPAGATDYPPTTTSAVTVAAASASHSNGAPAVAVAPAGLPRTGGNSSSMVWVGGVLVVAGAALAVSVRGRRRSARS